MMTSPLKRASEHHEDRILVVDDDRDFADSLCNFLTTVGYSVSATYNAEEAAEIIEDFDPQVALVDVRLGRANGIELVKKLKERWPHVLFISMTAFSEEDVAVAALRQGVYDYLRKPMSPEEILATIENAFGYLRIEEEKRTAEQLLRESQEKFQGLVDNLPSAINMKDLEGRYRFVNRQFEKWFGVVASDILGKTAHEVFSREYADLYSDQDQVVLATERAVENLTSTPLSDGELHLIRIIKFPVFGAARQKIGVGSINIDVTDQMRAEDRFHRYFDLPLIGSAIYTVEKKWIQVNDKLCALLGYSRDELMQLSWADLTHPDDLGENLRLFNEAISGARDTYTLDKRFIRKNGESIYCSVSVQCVRDQQGNPDYFLALVQDLSDRKQAEEALRVSEDRLKQAIQLSGLGYVVWDAVEDKCIYCSEEYARIHGTSIEDYLARSSDLEGELLFTHPDDRESVRAGLKALRAGRDFDMEYRVITPSGETRYVHEVAKPIFDRTGAVVWEHATAQDITKQKQIEEQLRQSQKMEAVGQLTGGVAHDVNNLLAVIMGNTEILMRQLGRQERSLDTIFKATKRGAELTHRLLAFSRQQPLRPQVIDLGALVSGMSDLLSRSLGETVEIEVQTDPDLRNALADPGQVENALLNLALNARDAMPSGGKLTIECSNIRLGESYVAENPETSAGDYVVLAVSDEGTGMITEVQAHVFEPFFTTKEVGEGSGLGLSMVYGFARQSGGQVTIYSEPGRGTTVKLYLPQANTPLRHGAAVQEQEVPLGRGELLLLIEDDPEVRALAMEMVQDLGYRVIDVPDAASAQAVLAAGETVDLVLSDVILPGGTSGPEFAEHARATYPGLKIIFMSGYPAEAAKRNGFLGSDQVLLNKPFQMDQLAKALRQALG